MGKGLSGGKVVVYPKAEALKKGFVPEDNVIVGESLLCPRADGSGQSVGRLAGRSIVQASPRSGRCALFFFLPPPPLLVLSINSYVIACVGCIFHVVFVSCVFFFVVSSLFLSVVLWFL